MGDAVNSDNRFTQGLSVPVLTAGLVMAAFVTGSLYSKVQLLQQRDSRPDVQRETARQAPVVDVPRVDTTKKVVSTDNDPVLGRADAPITIIEFSDFECPYCKRFFDDTLPQIKQNYIETGRVKLVYRDLPLSFHDPMATKEAVAANCARQQGGDDRYFEYHDKIFQRTKSNGNGLSEVDLVDIAEVLKLDMGKFADCRQDPVSTAEVKQDFADAERAGANGTPTFLIGRSTADGDIEGELVVGAQPYSVFKAILQTFE